MEEKREASHAGSWYSDVPSELDTQLTTWIEQARVTEVGAKAIIAPHAGYSYSGPTAAWSYVHIDPNKYSKVFLLGPSHHFYLSGCALPYSSIYNTPLGDIPVDQSIINSLRSTGLFKSLNKSQELAEHSLELHLPYIRKVFHQKPITLIPILVGHLENEDDFGMIFSEHFKNPENLFIISSDFCHWGRRFSFTPYDASCGEIWESIQKMDEEGMNIIETQDLSSFKSYLSRTKNTICGRNPIILLLSTIKCSNQSFHTKFVKYEQSSKVRGQSESSVSYAAGLTIC